LIVSNVLHNKAPETPVAVNCVLPQLFCTEIPGVEGIALTVNVAALELALPAIFVHTARYCFPLSPTAVVNDKVLLVAPPILLQLEPPFVLTCH
jgi:hypothetical protein